jgi:UDP-GlcNAc:undecaprenyl-phosphate GlcNAc-1-phosphate transferase
LALPVLDTTLVTVDRIRHGRSALSGGTDHLSHRIVAMGIPPDVAVAVLVGVEAVLASVAVACGSGVVPLWIGAALALMLLAGLVGIALRARVYPDPPIGFRRWPLSSADGARPELADSGRITLVEGPREELDS